jgi:hypothetical protein
LSLESKKYLTQRREDAKKKETLRLQLLCALCVKKPPMRTIIGIDYPTQPQKTGLDFGPPIKRAHK